MIGKKTGALALVAVRGYITSHYTLVTDKEKNELKKAAGNSYKSFFIAEVEISENGDFVRFSPMNNP